jgi:hypothetical protein
LTTALNLADRCNVVTTPQLDVDKVVKPSVNNDTKNRLWKCSSETSSPNTSVTDPANRRRRQKLNSLRERGGLHRHE